MILNEVRLRKVKDGVKVRNNMEDLIIMLVDSSTYTISHALPLWNQQEIDFQNVEYLL